MARQSISLTQPNDEWLKKQVDKKLLGVFSMGEFTKWVNLGNL